MYSRQMLCCRLIMVIPLLSVFVPSYANSDESQLKSRANPLREHLPEMFQDPQDLKKCILAEWYDSIELASGVTATIGKSDDKGNIYFTDGHLPFGNALGYGNITIIIKSGVTFGDFQVVSGEYHGRTSFLIDKDKCLRRDYSGTEPDTVIKDRRDGKSYRWSSGSWQPIE